MLETVDLVYSERIGQLYFFFEEFDLDHPKSKGSVASCQFFLKEDVEGVFEGFGDLEDFYGRGGEAVVLLSNQPDAFGFVDDVHLESPAVAEADGSFPEHVQVASRF
jgi:hypothetical protein